MLKAIAEDKAATLAITNKKGSWESGDTGVSAVYESDGIVLNGTAWYVQDAQKANIFVVSASSDAGIGLFCVDADANGVRIVRMPL